jgi:hypothetical protein
MIYAQISNGVIQNIIVLDDPTLEPLFVKGFDYLIRIDNLNPQPCMGWNYNPTNGFSPAS